MLKLVCGQYVFGRQLCGRCVFGRHVSGRQVCGRCVCGRHVYATCIWPTYSWSTGLWPIRFVAQNRGVTLERRQTFVAWLTGDACPMSSFVTGRTLAIISAGPVSHVSDTLHFHWYISTGTFLLVYFYWYIFRMSRDFIDFY